MLNTPFLSHDPEGRGHSLRVLGKGPFLGIKPKTINTYLQCSWELRIQVLQLFQHSSLYTRAFCHQFLRIQGLSYPV